MKEEEGVEECKDTNPDKEPISILCLDDCTVDHVHTPNKKHKENCSCKVCLMPQTHPMVQNVSH